MTKLKVGIIGLGGIARSHCDAIASTDNVEIVAVADLFEEKRRQYMEKYDIPRGYTTHKELLADSEVEAVAVVLGHHLHHQLTVDACNAGKHVMVEKPMALSLVQCDECQVICANGTLRFTQHGEKYVKVGKGDKWVDVPFDDAPAEMTFQWKAFAEAIEQDIEPPTHGEYGRHVMEILFAAEQSAITGHEVFLSGGQQWFHQTSGKPVTIQHGWI